MSNYTCKDYRQEMILLALRQRLEQEDLNAEEKKQIKQEIERLEKYLQMD